MYYFLYTIKKKYINEVYSVVENNIKDKYNLEYCCDLKDNIFISNKIISIRWDIFSTKYGLYKCFQNKEIINNCFLIHPNKKPKNSILDKFKNKKVYMKPTTISCLKKHYHSGKGIIITNNIENEKIKSHFFVQESIENPYLINGKKIDFRLYFLVTKNDKNLVFYLYKLFEIKICSKKYNSTNCNVKDKLSNWGVFLENVTNKYLKSNKKTLLSFKEIYSFLRNEVDNEDDLKEKNKLGILEDYDSESRFLHYIKPEKMLYKKNIISEFLQILKIYNEMDYSEHNKCCSVLPLKIRNKVFNDIKKGLKFNIFSNIPKTKYKPLNEYHLFAIDAGYDIIKKKTYIYEINGKIIPPGMSKGETRNQFIDMMIYKENIIDNLIQNKHQSCGNFKKIYHLKNTKKK